MEQLFENITSPGWWIGVFLVGILINILSAYLKPNLDKFLSNTSSRWRKKIEAERSRRASLVGGLREDKETQVYFALFEIRMRFHVIYFLFFFLAFQIMALFLINIQASSKIPIYICLICSFVCFLISVAVFRESNSIGSIISDARSHSKD